VDDRFCARPRICPERSWGSGGIQNTGGGLQQQGIPIPHPPLISAHRVTGATVNDNERKSFEEGIARAGQLEATCDSCNDVTDGSPVPGELDPVFPQVRTNSNGTGARHNADQCFVCHAQPQLGGSGGFIVPNPADPVPQQAENPQFRLVPHRFGRQNVVPSFETQYGPIREVRFRYKPDGTRDGGVHQLWKISPVTVKKMAREGWLPAHAIGNGVRKRWRFRISELVSHMRCRVESEASSVRVLRRKAS
jgi:hypothetical protein